MKPRNLVVLTVVVAVFAAFILFYERHQPTTEEARQRADKVFPDLERDQVQTLAIHNSHGDFTLVRKDGTWRLTSPIDFPADGSAVSSLLGSLTSLKQERRLQPSEVEGGAYGLDSPPLKVTATTEKGASYELAVGEETPLGSKRAVRRDDDKDILLCAGWFVKDIDKPLDDWRSRNVLDVSADQVASLQVASGKDHVQVAKEGELWKLLEPVKDLADRDQVRGVINDLDSLRVEEFVDGQQVQPGALGLDAPTYRVTVIRDEGQAPIELDFGKTRQKDGATQIACRRSGDEVFWVKDDISTRLAKAPVRWRSPKVFPFDTWNVDKLSLGEGEKTVSVARAEGLWKTSAGGDVDGSAVQQRLSSLAGLEAKEFDLVQPATAKMGQATVELRAPGADASTQPTSVTYTFYRPLTRGGDAMVTVSARSTVMSVDAAAAEKILADPGALSAPQPEPTTTPAEQGSPEAPPRD